MAGRRLVAYRFTGAECAEHGVVEALRTLDVIRADHDVIEHSLSPWMYLRIKPEKAPRAPLQRTSRETSTYPRHRSGALANQRARGAQNFVRSRQEYYPASD